MSTRVELGDRISLRFTPRSAVESALDETIRVEWMSGSESIDRDAAVAAFAPPPGSVGAILFADTDDAGSLRDLAVELEGVRRSLYLEAGDQRVAAQPAPPGDVAVALPVLFTPTEAQWAVLRDAAEVAVGVDGADGVRVVLDPQQRTLLFEDS